MVIATDEGDVFKCKKCHFRHFIPSSDCKFKMVQCPKCASKNLEVRKANILDRILKSKKGT